MSTPNISLLANGANLEMIVAIDQGTTGSAVAFFEIHTLALLAHHKTEFPQIYPQSGWVEHNPADIWQSTCTSLAKAWEKTCAAHPGAVLSQIKTVGITNQRETCLGWNLRTGELAGNALVWQDRRTADFCASLKKDEGTRKRIFNTTGLVCDPYFSASKMRYLLQNSPVAATWANNGELALGTIDSFLVYQLSGQKSFATEHSNASRTMLYSLQTGTYDSDLCKLFEIPERALAPILDSAAHFGTTLKAGILPDGIPITGILGDQQAALFGQNCERPGEAKITYGTGAFLLMNTGTSPVFSDDGLLSTVALSANGKRTFALEGAAFIAGAAVQYLRDNWNFIETAAQVEALANKDSRDEHVMFVPSLAGLSAPYWNPHAKGVLFGLSRGTTKSQVARAVVESIALQNANLLKLMEKAAGRALLSAGVDGGAAQNNSLMQFQSDILRVQLTRPVNTETTAQGAARVARLGLEPQSAVSRSATEKTFAPNMPQAQSEALLAQWLRAASAVNAFYS